MKKIVTACLIFAILFGMFQISKANSYVFNVKDYGAFGNGISDDTSGISSAVIAAGEAGGGVVIIPYGKYVVKSTISVPSGVKISGDNGTAIRLRTTNSACAFSFDGVQDVGISSLAFETVNPCEAIVRYSAVRNLLIEDVSVTGSPLVIADDEQSDSIVFQRIRAEGSGTAFKISNTEGLRISDNMLSGYTKNVVAVDSENLTIERNIFQSGTIEISGTSQLHISANSVIFGGISIENIKRAMILNNHIINPVDFGICLLGGCVNVAIRGNIIRTSNSEVNLIISDGVSSNVQISANNITKDIGDDGVSSGSGLANIKLNEINGLLFSNNHLINAKVNIVVKNGISQVEQNTILIENIAPSSYISFRAVAYDGVLTILRNVFRNIAEQNVTSTGLEFVVNGGEINITGNNVRGFDNDIRFSGNAFQAVQKPIVTVSDNFLCANTVYLPQLLKERINISFDNNKNEQGDRLDLSNVSYMSPTIGAISYYKEPVTYVAKIYTENGWRDVLDVANKDNPINFTYTEGFIYAVVNSFYLNRGDKMILAVYDNTNKLNNLLISNPWNGKGSLKLSCEVNAVGWVKAYIWKDLDSLQPNVYRSRYVTDEMLSE